MKNAENSISELLDLKISAGGGGGGGGMPPALLAACTFGNLQICVVYAKSLAMTPCM